jgi:radical SAM-linked protein
VKIRLLYNKLAEAKYVAHLDLTRFLERALRRAGVPVARSQGFNPHARISFGPPLAVGVEGLGEYADVEIQSDGRLKPAAAAEQAVRALRAQMPPNISILDYCLLPPGAPALTAIIDLACYLAWIPLREPRAEAELERALADWLAQAEIMVVRTKEGGARPVSKNIRPFVRRLALRGAAATGADGPGFGLELEIGLSNAGSAKAAEVVRSLCAFAALPWEQAGLSLVRTGLFAGGEKRLSPLLTPCPR